MQTNKKYVEPGKELPVSYEVDVLVCGGGPSGIAAAVSAAKNGAEVMLIERFNCLGGQGTIGLVTSFCPCRLIREADRLLRAYGKSLPIF